MAVKGRTILAEQVADASRLPRYHERTLRILPDFILAGDDFNRDVAILGASGAQSLAYSPEGFIWAGYNTSNTLAASDDSDGGYLSTTSTAGVGATAWIDHSSLGVGAETGTYDGEVYVAGIVGAIGATKEITAVFRLSDASNFITVGADPNSGLALVRAYSAGSPKSADGAVWPGTMTKALSLPLGAKVETYARYYGDEIEAWVSSIVDGGKPVTAHFKFNATYLSDQAKAGVRIRGTNQKITQFNWGIERALV